MIDKANNNSDPYRHIHTQTERERGKPTLGENLPIFLTTKIRVKCNLFQYLMGIFSLRFGWPCAVAKL